MPGTSLGRFVLRVAAWLPPAFLIWYLAGPILAWPIGLVTEGALKTGFGRLMADVHQQGHLLRIGSTLKPAAASTENLARAELFVDVNVLLYSFGLPLLAALIAAARAPHPLRQLAFGYIVLAPFVSFGLVAEFLKNLAFDAGPSVAAQAGFDPLQRETIVFAYQFGSLIVPTVVPAVYWVLTHRAFLEGFTLRGSRRDARAP